METLYYSLGNSRHIIVHITDLNFGKTKKEFGQLSFNMPASKGLVDSAANCTSSNL